MTTAMTVIVATTITKMMERMIKTYIAVNDRRIITSIVTKTTTTPPNT